MKLYQFNIRNGGGPRLLAGNITPAEAGRLCFDRNHKENVFMLLNGCRMYYYINVSGGFGWQVCEGENGPMFL